MKRISNVLMYSFLGAAVLTGCKDDDKRTVEKEEIHGINLAYMDTTDRKSTRLNSSHQ